MKNSKNLETIAELTEINAIRQIIEQDCPDMPDDKKASLTEALAGSSVKEVREAINEIKKSRIS